MRRVNNVKILGPSISSIPFFTSFFSDWIVLKDMGFSMFYSSHLHKCFLLHKELDSELRKCDELDETETVGSLLRKWFESRCSTFYRNYLLWSEEMGKRSPTSSVHFPTWWGATFAALMKEKYFIFHLALSYSKHCNPTYNIFENPEIPKYMLFTFRDQVELLNCSVRMTDFSLDEAQVARDCSMEIYRKTRRQGLQKSTED
jgi:hypothetical protein